ncbi:PAS domain S-box protein [Haloarcula salina]|uniref:histidine kinase n=1 Tax=Haloarcula salina TaxID=1429914 RepID=A0AA41G182_9EURY|nr:PAS domain S-box protein [Haloarcula salina]MBV0902361.1 PAS domain S-box protein [Haloarcula salina]
MTETGGPIRVLHVDDEPDFADTVAAVIEREDERLSVATATSAREGLDRLADGQFDCVVSDYDMPEMNGIEFLRAVREEDPELPFILFTGRGSETVASEAISAGVTDYLQKERGLEQYSLLANDIENAVERARAERARERHLEAIETAREGISILDEDGTFRYVNEAYADLYGYAPEEMHGEHWALIYPDDEVDLATEEILPTVAEEGYWHGESTGLRADGSTFPEDHVVSQTASGDLVCTVRDLTDRREREDALQQRGRMLDEAPVGITLSDPSREDNPLVYANEEFEELTGYDAEEVNGRNCRFLQGDDTDPEAVAEMRSAIADGERVTVELRNYRKDGTEFWNRITIAPLGDSAGEVANFVGFQEDVTERKRHERQLEQQNERLERLASTVSHDLRNPLDVARGNLRLARSECDSDALDDVERAHERMAALIDDLLTVARGGDPIEDGEPIALGGLVAECWRGVSTGEATLDIEVDRTVEADRSRLRQLVENLLRNAVEHGGDDVTVTVGDLEDGWYVEDDGPGIPAAHRDTVFDADFSTGVTGTGFGLRIVEQVATEHGWTVRATESEAGGARFEIRGVTDEE